MNIKKILQIGIVISLFLVPLPISSFAENNIKTDHIVINEVCWNVTNPMAWWFELYNPTFESINVTGWWIWFLSVDGPVDIPHLIIPADGYAIVCRNKENFSEYWAVPDYIEIVETPYEDWGCINDSFSIDDHNKRVDTVGQDNDYILLPTIHLNHSWARYKGGYDTDNFTNDFYDEATPTPGYENTKSKFPNQVPTVSITSPSEGFQTVSGIITIAGNASDVDGDVQAIEIKIDNGDWITASGNTSWSYAWDTTKVSDGEHIISVRAFDGYDYSATKTVTVNVDNKKEKKGFIPGFETPTIIAIIGICILLLRKQQKINLKHKD